jgi:CHAD domain-containing protein
MSAQQLRSTHSGTSEVRRLARGGISRARKMLEAGSLTDAAVHGARKEIRKSRAAVRLLREALGHARFQRENERLRDVGRALNGARDARILVLALDVLRRSHPRLAHDQAVTELSDRLRERQRAERRALHRAGAPIVSARRTLAQTQYSAGQWPVGDGGWETLGPAFKRLYATGHEAARKSRRRPDDSHLHEWRKHVKNLRHALQVFQPLEPSRLSRQLRLARRLADSLGEGHDLALLRQSADGIESKPLRAAIDRRRRELRRQAFELGDKVYAESPAAMDRRLRRYWHRWRHQAR